MGIDMDTMADDPLEQFQSWMEEAIAAGQHLPNAMTIATVSVDGRPSARITLLKGVDDSGFVFFSNYESRKGTDLASNPYAALVFHWSELGRQVRVEGRVERASVEESLDYFRTRSRGSQIGAWASPQSRVIESRAVLDELVSTYSARFDGRDVDLPALGRIPVIAGSDRVLEGTAEPPTRPHCLFM